MKCLLEGGSEGPNVAITLLNPRWAICDAAVVIVNNDQSSSSHPSQERE